VIGSDPPSRVNGSLVPYVPESIAWAEVDGETVLYDEVQKKVHVLSPTATLVWSGIDGRTSLQQIARDLSQSFGEALQVVRSDVLELARDLMERGLIIGAGSADSSERDLARSGIHDPATEGRATMAPRFLEDPPKG
jgi:hypothetical protein